LITGFQEGKSLTVAVVVAVVLAAYHSFPNHETTLFIPFIVPYITGSTNASAIAERIPSTSILVSLRLVSLPGLNVSHYHNQS
jgi:hypothetical protein